MQARLKAVQIQMEELQRRMAEVTNSRQKVDGATKPRQTWRQKVKVGKKLEAANSVEVTPIVPTQTRTLTLCHPRPAIRGHY